MRSRVGTHRSGAKYPREALFKGRNIQELSVRDTSVGDTSTLHPNNGVAVAVGGGGGTRVVEIMMPLQYDPGQNHGLMKPLVLLWF